MNISTVVGMESPGKNRKSTTVHHRRSGPATLTVRGPSARPTAGPRQAGVHRAGPRARVLLPKATDSRPHTGMADSVGPIFTGSRMGRRIADRERR